MTREEAIAYFKDMNECTYGDVEPIQMAIKALEQEHCEDAVSRAEVINGLQKICDECDSEFCGDCRIDTEGTSLDSAKEMLKRLPSVTPTTKWIPCSERLPEVGERVLCQCQANIYEVLKLTVDGWYHDNKHCYMSGFVIAWMPLPDLYKAESEV